MAKDRSEDATPGNRSILSSADNQFRRIECLDELASQFDPPSGPLALWQIPDHSLDDTCEMKRDSIGGFSLSEVASSHHQVRIELGETRLQDLSDQRLVQTPPELRHRIILSPARLAPI